jgi:hypothetical protein
MANRDQFATFDSAMTLYATYKHPHNPVSPPSGCNVSSVGCGGLEMAGTVAAHMVARDVVVGVVAIPMPSTGWASHPRLTLMHRLTSLRRGILPSSTRISVQLSRARCTKTSMAFPPTGLWILQVQVVAEVVPRVVPLLAMSTSLAQAASALSVAISELSADASDKSRKTPTRMTMTPLGDPSVMGAATPAQEMTLPPLSDNL